MEIDIRHNPAYAVAYCGLRTDEAILAEAGAMVTMSGGLAVSTNAGPGGAVKGIMRKTFTNEGFFMTKFRAVVNGAWVALAPTYPGDIAHVTLRSDQPGVVAEAGSLLGLSESISADPRWARMTMVAMREGATMTRLRGDGDVLLSAYGAIQEHALQAGQTLIFDSGHVVAFTEGMDVKVGPLKGLLTATLSGEGIVAEIKGPGRVWTQTRAVLDAGSWFMPKKQPRGAGRFR